MKYVRFGQTDMMVSIVSFGCWELGGTQWELTSDETNLKVLRRAFAAGITSFDTAEGYGAGHSEEIVGQALHNVRHEIFLASKVSPVNLHAADVRRSVEASLRRLRTDYLDLAYLHWPNDEIPLEETLAEFSRLKQEGKIRAIGVSNFSLRHLQAATALARIDALQSEYSLLQRELEADALPFCQQNGLSFFCYSPLAKGLLTGAYHLGDAVLKESDFRIARRLFIPEHRRLETELILTLRDLADARSVPIGNLALAWLLHQPAVTSVIVGTQNETHLLGNLGAADIELSSDELALLRAASDHALAAIAEVPVAPFR